MKRLVGIGIVSYDCLASSIGLVLAQGYCIERPHSVNQTDFLLDKVAGYKLLKYLLAE